MLALGVLVSCNVRAERQVVREISIEDPAERQAEATQELARAIELLAQVREDNCRDPRDLARRVVEARRSLDYIARALRRY